MLKTAASVGLCPSEFWGLSLREFEAVCKGHQVAKKSDVQVLAWATANLMNCWVKKKITVEKLLGSQDRETISSGSDIKEQVKKRREQREQKEYWGK